MNEFAPNLYEYFGLNPQESSDVLGVTLSERIGQLEHCLLYTSDAADE